MDKDKDLSVLELEYRVSSQEFSIILETGKAYN
jgi:hypothetical protein